MLLFMDGQAHYDTARIGMKYSSISTTACTWTVESGGRFGNCIKRLSTSNASSSGYLSIAPLTTRLGTWTPTTGGVCGFAIKVDDLVKTGGSTISPADTIFMLIEGVDYHLRVNLNRDGTFSLYRNIGAIEGSDGPDLMAVSSEGLTEGTWMFLEFKWLIHASAGTFQIRVNGITVLTYTGDTREHDLFFSSLGVWNAVRLLGVNSSATAPLLVMRMCDLYLADLASTLGDDVHDFLGDGIIETILPDGVGSSTGWTPNTGTNWDATNDSPSPDDDTTYVAATGTGLKDLYHFQDIPAGSEVKGVHVNILARKEEEGAASIAPIVHPTTVDYVGPTQGVTSVDYDRYVTQAWDLNPETGVRFTAAEINAGQFGVQKMV